MKKKLLISVFAMMLLFAGVVGAASINGDFEGNPIIKVKSNGQVLPVEDTPAVLYNDRTMVPIYMLRNLGVEVEWIAEEYAVDVKLPETDNDSSKDIANLVLSVMNQYKTLEDFGELIDSYHELNNLAFDEIDLYGTNSRIVGLSEDLEYLESSLDKKKEIATYYTQELTKAGLEDETMEKILEHYDKSIEYYKLSKSGLDQFYLNQTQSNFDTYLDNSASANNEVFEAMKISSDKYDEYFQQMKYYLAP